jgi:hypothetical protein
MTQTSNRILGQKALNLIFSHCEYEFLSEEEMAIELEVKAKLAAHLK